MRVASLVYTAFFTASTVTGASCPPGEWEVSLRGSGTVYCVGSQPCSGWYNGNDAIGKFGCPQMGQPNIDDTIELDYNTCCGVFGGNTLGCVRKTDGAVCKGPEPAPWTPRPTTPTPAPTTVPVTTETTSPTPAPTTTSSDSTPSATTLSPNGTTTTLTPGSTTTVTPGSSTTLTPGATTPSPTTRTPESQVSQKPGVTSSDGTPIDGSSTGGLATGWIIFIIVGVLALALIVGLILFRKKQPPPSYMASPAEGSREVATGGAGAAAAMETGGGLTPKQNVTLL